MSPDPKARRDPLARVRVRPDVEQWRPDDSITLVEAAALFFPDGPLTVKSFRAAAKRGDLAVRRISGRDFTTPESVREMLKPSRAPREDRGSASKAGAADRRSASSATPEAMLAAQAAALTSVREMREKLRQQGKKAPK